MLTGALGGILGTVFYGGLLRYVCFYWASCFQFSTSLYRRASEAVVW